MSIFSDHKCGALSDDEFASECIRMNEVDKRERDMTFAIDEEDNADDVDCEFEYEFNRCNACEDAKHCKKVEVWNNFSHNKNIVAKRGTFDAIYNSKEEDYDI